MKHQTKAKATLLAGAFALCLAASPPARADDAPDPVLGQRSAVTLTASELKQLLQLTDPELRQKIEHDPAALAQRVRERLLQLTLLAEAKKQQWDQRPEVKLRAQLAAEAAVVDSFVAAQAPNDPAFPTDDQVQKAYDANKSKLMLPRQFHVAQIFIAAPASTGVQGDADGLRRSTDAHTQLVKQKADFAALAKKLSEDKGSAANGGDMGFLREDNLIPPIRAAVSALAEGAVSDPIRSPQGWHIVKLIGTKPATPMTLAEAHDALVRALRQERAAQLQRNYITNLLHDDPIQVNEIEINKLTAK